jgi:hypothetical protein
MLHHYDENTTCNASLINPFFSVAAIDHPASNALNGLLSQTDSTGVGIYWGASIDGGPGLVQSVLVTTNTEENTGYRLAEVDVFVDNEICG